MNEKDFMKIWPVLKMLLDSDKEIAAAALNEYRRLCGHNEAVEALFQLADILRKEKNQHVDVEVNHTIPAL